MILLTSNEMILLHSKLIEKTGGIDGVRDINLLESAVGSIYSGFGDYERYTTIEEKAARLCYGLISNHAFVDGNKRIGILIMLMTLDLNSIDVIYFQKELIELGLNVASGQTGYDDIYNWILSHKLETNIKSL